jgi:hypothetical protein
MRNREEALAQQISYSYGDGRITKVVLENDSTYSSPGVSLPIGTSCLIHVWAKNYTANAEQLGIKWVAYDPDNVKVETYETWESWPYTGSYKEHEFIGGRFNLTKAGTYVLVITLLMNKSAPVIVYGWGDELCTATPVAPPGWVLLGSADIIVSPIPEAVDWVLLGSVTIAVSPIPVQLDWVFLGSCTVTVKPGAVTPPPELCSTDADCPSGYKCVNGICVPEEEAGEFPWALALAGGLGLVALILLAKPEVPPSRKPPEKKKAKKP